MWLVQVCQQEVKRSISNARLTSWPKISDKLANWSCVGKKPGHARIAKARSFLMARVMPKEGLSNTLGLKA